MTIDNESPFVLEPVHRAQGGEPARAPAPASPARYRAELEGSFELESLAKEPFAGEAMFQATGRREPEEKQIRWELEPAFEQLVSRLTSTVGKGRASNPDDIRRVQVQLRQLGMSWVPDSGTIGSNKDDPTDHGIRLFRAMLDGGQLWSKKEKSSPCYVALEGSDRGIIEPGSREETWLWSSGAPRWLTTAPRERDGWCCNDRDSDRPEDLGCHNDIAEPAMSSWLPVYLDQVGRAFRAKVQAFRPVLATLAAQGLPALERLSNPSLPSLGPHSYVEAAVKRTAAIAQRVAMDLVKPASAHNLDPVKLAGETLAAIDGGRIILTLTYIAVPKGGCSTNHAGHQQGLEFDLRLFAHDGPRPGLTWDHRKHPRYSRLLTGLAVDCFLEHSATRRIIYNDPVIYDRVGRGVECYRTKVDGHDNHVHVGIKGTEAHPLPPVPIPALPSILSSGRSALELSPPASVDESALSLERHDAIGRKEHCSTCGRATQEADVPIEPRVPCPPLPRSDYTMADYIALVRKVEAAYPRWTPDQVLSALRRVAGYDGPLFRLLYVTVFEANEIKAGDGDLIDTDLCMLKGLSSHGDGPIERGVVFDPLGQRVAVGHVLCGLSAGEHRHRNFGMTPAWLAAASTAAAVTAAVQRVAGLTLDNLYATTIAGDLGQSAVKFHLKLCPALLGSQSEATDAELIGDIDGCVLASNGSLGGRRVSEVLSSYYSISPAARGGIHAAYRFRMFAAHLNGSVLEDQTKRFAMAYLIQNYPRDATESVASEAQQVLTLFRAWYAKKVSEEIARPPGAQRELGELIAEQTGTELSYGEQLTPGIKTHALRVWNTENVDTHVSFAIDEATTTVTITIVSQTPRGPSSNTMVLSGARKAADGTEVTGHAKNQPDGSGGQFTAYLKLQALASEMVVRVFKNVLGKYVAVAAYDRHYRYQASNSQADLLAFIGSLQLGASEFEL